MAAGVTEPDGPDTTAALPPATSAEADDDVMSEQPPDLQAAVNRLADLDDQAYAALLARSAREFAAGEGQPDPLQSYPLHAPPSDDADASA